MGTRFGFHSGDVHAKNFVAGKFTVSGSQLITYTAVTFPRSVKTSPDSIQVTQLSEVSGASAYTTAVSGSRMISGVSLTGFTYVIDHDQLPMATVASGAKFIYTAFDYVR